MKNYVKPVFECVELRMEERMAGSCAGATGNPPEGHCTTTSL